MRCLSPTTYPTPTVRCCYHQAGFGASDAPPSPTAAGERDPKRQRTPTTSQAGRPSGSAAAVGAPQLALHAPGAPRVLGEEQQQQQQALPLALVPSVDEFPALPAGAPALTAFATGGSNGARACSSGINILGARLSIPLDASSHVS